MRKVALYSSIIFVMLLVSVATGVGIANAGNNANGLVGYWPAAGNLNDLSGHNNRGISWSGAFVEGRVGRAFSFSGSHFVQVPDSDSWAFGNNDFTINLWAKFSSLPAAGEHGVIFIGDDEGGGERNKWFFSYGNNTLKFHVNGPTPIAVGGINLATSNFTPATNRWYNLAVTRENNFLTIYVDGVFVGDDNNPVSIPNPNAPLTIGQAEGIGFMDGLIDEVRIYNQALSVTEIGAQIAADIVKSTAPNVLLYGSDPSHVGDDVFSTISNAGLFSEIVVQVKCGGFPIPSLADLQEYSAVMVWSDCGFKPGSALGDVLADYVDGGGRLVVSTFALAGPPNQYLSPRGRLITDEYLPVTGAGTPRANSGSLVADLPEHPLLEGVNTFNAAHINRPLQVASGATLVAHWPGDVPLVAI